MYKRIPNNSGPSATASFKIQFENKLLYSLVGETKGSALPLSKSGHNPRPVLFTSKPHNLILLD
jgi:hypothetical protein